MSSSSGIVGISQGSGIPAPLAETNLSASPAFSVTPLSEDFADGHPVDVRNAQLIYEPVPGSGGAYRNCFRSGVFALPVDDTAAVPLSAEEQNVPRAMAVAVPVLDQIHPAVSVSRRGTLSFITPGFSARLDAWYFRDWIRVTHQSLDGREVFTWKGTSAPGGEADAMQAELHGDGRIRITWLNLPADGFAGILRSAPAAVPPSFEGSFRGDLSNCPPPPLPEVNVFTLSGQVSEQDPAQGPRLLITRTGFTDHPLVTALVLTPESTASAADSAGPVPLITIPAGSNAVMPWPFLPPNPDTLPEGPELAVLRFIQMGTVVAGPHHEARFTILDRPVQDWMHRNGFQTTPLGSDSDGDGITNLEEYATGSDPRVPGLAGTPESSLTHHAGTLTLHASAPLNPDASSISAVLQYSTGLTAWTDGPPLALPENGGLSAEASLTFTGTPARLFTRVRFRLLP